MKWALRNKTAKKRLKMAIFKLVSLICIVPYIFLSFIQTILPSSIVCENTRKSLNQQIWVWHISKYCYFPTFQVWG